MGLDMYMHTHRGAINDTGDKVYEELFYWRKHNALHNWMAKLYDSRHAQDADYDPEFNCTALDLTRLDLLRLKADILEHNLVPVSGFFFGTTEYDPAECMNNDLEAVNLALDEVEAGNAVSYSAWY